MRARETNSELRNMNLWSLENTIHHGTSFYSTSPGESHTRASVSIVVQNRRTHRIPLQTNVAFTSGPQSYQHFFHVFVSIVTKRRVELFDFLKHSSDWWIIEREISVPLVGLYHATQPQFVFTSWKDEHKALSVFFGLVNVLDQRDAHGMVEFGHQASIISNFKNTA